MNHEYTSRGWLDNEVLTDRAFILKIGIINSQHTSLFNPIR